MAWEIQASGAENLIPAFITSAVPTAGGSQPTFLLVTANYCNNGSSLASSPPSTPGSANSSPSTTPIRIAPATQAHQNPSSPLRCKRRLDFAKFGYNLPKAQPVTVSRRNERERNRVKTINSTFVRLRQQLPTITKNGKARKMSKVDTLRCAIEYIKHLQELLDDGAAVDAAFSAASLAPVLSPCGSVDSSEAESLPEPYSPDEEDLLDFSSWFD